MPYPTRKVQLLFFDPCLLRCPLLLFVSCHICYQVVGEVMVFVLVLVAKMDNYRFFS